MDARNKNLSREIARLYFESDYDYITEDIYNTNINTNTNGGVNFCVNLRLHELAVNYFGELIFCCDTIGPGAVIGSLKEYSLSELMSKWLSISAALQSKRVDDISNGNHREGFNTCEYCNSYFMNKK